MNFENVSMSVDNGKLLVTVGSKVYTVACPSKKEEILPEGIRLALAKCEDHTILKFSVNPENQERLNTIHRLDSLHDGEESWIPVAELAIKRDLVLAANGDTNSYYMPVAQNGIKLLADGALIPQGKMSDYRRVTYRTKIRQIVARVLQTLPIEGSAPGRVHAELAYQTMAESRLTRQIFGLQESPKDVYRVVTNPMTGRPIVTSEETTTYQLVDTNTGWTDPVLIFQATEMPWEFEQNEYARYEHDKSVEILKNGVDIPWTDDQGKEHVRHYSFLLVSASGKRTMTIVLVADDVKLPRDIMDALTDKDQEYADKVAALPATEQIWEVLTYGGWLTDMKGKIGSPAKISTRIAQCLSSSITLGRVKACSMGKVILKWGPVHEEGYRKYYTDLGFSEEKVTEAVDLLRKFWKENVWDGCNIIRSETFLKLLKRAGIAREGEPWTLLNIIGNDGQIRYASDKGMAVPVPSTIIDNIMIDGIAWFKGYDLLLEESSIKYKWNAAIYSDGILEPQLELVGMVKSHGSNTVDSQLLNCLEFNSLEDMEMLRDKISQIAQNGIEIAGDIQMARMDKGVFVESMKEDDFLSPFSQPRNFHDGWLQTTGQQTGRVTEPYVASGIGKDQNSAKDKAEQGRLKVNGDRRFMIPDISPLWMGTWVKAEGIDFLTGRDMYDLLVTDAALKDVGKVWSCGNTGPMATYRNPLNSSREIGLVTGMSLEEITDERAQLVYGGMRQALVISCFSSLANIMGGGDYDGDTAMCIFDEMILPLIRPSIPLLVDVGGIALKLEFSYESIKNSVAESLANAGIGLITNWGATWMELAHIIRGLIIKGDEKVILPMVKSTVKNDEGDIPEPIGLYSFLFNKGGKGKGKPGVCELAAKELLARKDQMIEIEREACEALVEMTNVKSVFETKRKGHEVSLAELEAAAPVIIEACEAMVTMVRYLQELAINTAKSDRWALYHRVGAVLVPHHMYDYLAIRVRPSWKRSDKSFTCNLTPMGVVVEESDRCFKAMMKAIMANVTIDQDLAAAPANELLLKVDKMVTDYNRDMSEVTLRLLKLAPKKTVYDIAKQAKFRFKGLDKEKRKELRRKEIERMTRDYTLKLADLQAEHGMYAVLRAAYTATYKHANIAEGKKISFVYRTMTEELLSYINQRESGDQVVPVKVIPNRLYAKSITDNQVKTHYEKDSKGIGRTWVLDGEGDIIGRVNVTIGSEGPWDLRVNDGELVLFYTLPRIEKAVSSKEVGHEIRIVGMSDYGMNSSKMVGVMASKHGLGMLQEALGMKLERTLSKYEDVFRIVRETRNNGTLEVPCLAMYHGDVRVANVAPDQASVSYINRLLEKGDHLIMEVKPGNKSEKSMTMKVIDVICE